MFPFAGSILHPGVLSYDFELRPTLRQAGSTELPSGLNSRSLGFASNATVLGAKPVRLDLNLDRISGRSAGGFGTRSEFEFTGLGAGMTWSNRLLPVTARIDTRTGTSLTEVGRDLLPISRSDRSVRGQVTIRNRKLDAAAEWTSIDDRLRSADLESRNLRVNHRLRWGKGSELLTKWRRSDRSGATFRMSSTWSEQIRVQHSSSSRTTLSFSRSVSDGTGARAANRTLGWTFSARPLPGVSLGGRASANRSDFEGGRQRNVSWGPQASIRFALPLRMRLTGGAFLGYLLRDIDGSTGGMVPVLNEEHEIGPTRAIRLNQSRVDPTSIEVRSSDETTLYVPLLDYEVIPLGGLTEVQIPPGSRIIIGQKIVISYRFTVTIDSEEKGVVSRFNLGLSRGGLRIQHTRSERATDFSGTSTPVSGDFNQNSTSITANFRMPFGRLRASVIDRRRRSDLLDYDFREGSASFLFPVWHGLQSSLDAGGSRAKDRDGRTSRVSLGLATRWAVRPELLLDGSLSALRWAQERGLRQRIYVAVIGLTWRVGRLDARARYQYSNRDGTSSAFTDGRLTMDITRRF